MKPAACSPRAAVLRSRSPMQRLSLLRDLSRLAVPLLALVLAACVTETTGPPHPSNKPDYKAAAKINTELGLNYASQGMFDVAEIKLKKAVEQDDTLAQAHGGLA